jgi:hypothetical protein
MPQNCLYILLSVQFVQYFSSLKKSAHRAHDNHDEKEINTWEDLEQNAVLYCTEQTKKLNHQMIYGDNT